MTMEHCLTPGNVTAALWHRPDDAFVAEYRHRTAYRRPGHPEDLDEFLLRRKNVARLQVTGGDLVSEPSGDLLVRGQVSPVVDLRGLGHRNTVEEPGP
jgi:hypothetical protein